MRRSHHVNLTPIFFTFYEKPWIPTAMKIRMLEYKIRVNLVTYLAVGCPPLDFSPVADYKPREKPVVPKPTGAFTLPSPTLVAARSRL